MLFRWGYIRPANLFQAGKAALSVCANFSAILSGTILVSLAAFDML
jgi:hypothetical protein